MTIQEMSDFALSRLLLEFAEREREEKRVSPRAQEIRAEIERRQAEACKQAAQGRAEGAAYQRAQQPPNFGGIPRDKSRNPWWDSERQGATRSAQERTRFDYDTAKRMFEEARRYTYTKPPPPPRRKSPIDVLRQNGKLARRLVKVGYRQLSKEMHPDQGGETAEMQALNAVKAALDSWLEAEGVKS